MRSLFLNSASMKLRILALISMVIAGAVLGGCNTGNDRTAHQKSTFFGLYTYEPAIYAPTSDYSLNLRTDDACGMELPSGDKTSFAWGLVTVEDY